jgi:hypothetical protein
MTNTQIKRLAKLFVANVAYHALGTADGSKLLTDEEYEKFQEVVYSVTNKILKDANIPTEALFIGSLDNLIEYVQK